MNTEKIAIQIAKNIRKQEPTLDLQGADRKVLQVALQDMTNYLSYIQNMHQPIETEENTAEASAEISAFFAVWTSTWLKKWSQRFGLLIGQNASAQIAKTTQTPSKNCVQWENLECREELTQMIVDALIKRSEICGTKIIAEDILRKEVQEAADSEDVNSRENVFKILNRALAKVQAIAQSAGPLVFIQIQKSYYCNYQLA